MNEERALGLQRNLGFSKSIVVKAEGLSGRLLLLWRQEVMVAELSKSRSHIDVLLSCDRLRIPQLRITGFYGELRQERRKESWYLMRFLKAQSDSPWLCLGDFNEVLLAEEQFGGNGREPWQVAAFQDAVSDCHLSDLGFHGLLYTWDNRQEGDRNVKVRLDRALGDDRFMSQLGVTEVFHLPLAESDHCGLLVEVRETVIPGRRRGRRKPRPFRYENMWKSHGEYMEFVNRTWDPGEGPCNLTAVSSALMSVQSALKKWDREVFGSVKEKVKKLRADLEMERSQTLYTGPTTREREIVAELADVLAREETMERQRSRISWLREGDRNTAFFQAKARARNRTNRIKVLTDEAGHTFTEQEDLERLACQFYQNLFSAQGDLQPELICQHVPQKVTPEMRELEQPFTELEVESALFQMAPNKSPGVDGFSAGFFQTHWQLVKPGVVSAVLGFLNGGDLPEDVNMTLLVLIPKTSNPQDLSQYRPISLCNVLYKLCSKTMANRLRLILDDVISDEQSAFVLGRLIMDNVLIAYECIHYLRIKKGKSGGCAIKLDMATAYDRVEWNYLNAIMLALGFPASWCSLVMKCVSSVSFSVRVNGVFSESFIPTRGIRQGDPISPYLFLLCSEGLSCMIKNIGPQYISRGVRVSRAAPWISHLLFADDCIIFSPATKRGADRVAAILNDYHRGSGQLVNKQKSAILFSTNCQQGNKEEVHTSLQISTEALGEKYLGLPTAAGRGATAAFDYVPA